MSRVFQNVFQDDLLIDEYMKSLPITPNLSKNLKAQATSSNMSSLDIYFLNQWIKTSSSFQNKRSFDLNNWLCEQIKQCSQPLHPIIVSLINTYVFQLFNPNIVNENRLTPFSSTLILQFLKEKYITTSNTFKYCWILFRLNTFSFLFLATAITINVWRPKSYSSTIFSCLR